MNDRLRLHSDRLILRKSFGASDQDLIRWSRYYEGKMSLSEFIRRACDAYIKQEGGDGTQ